MLTGVKTKSNGDTTRRSVTLSWADREGRVCMCDYTYMDLISLHCNRRSPVTISGTLQNKSTAFTVVTAPNQVRSFIQGFNPWWTSHFFLPKILSAACPAILLLLRNECKSHLSVGRTLLSPVKMQIHHGFLVLLAPRHIQLHNILQMEFFKFCPTFWCLRPSTDQLKHSNS